MFLPTTKKEMESLGVSTLDFVYITGDAYVDHPSFGVSVISRVLEANGFSVGIVAQPNCKNTDDIKKFGRPKLGFLVTAGNLDSMVANYTVAKRRRSDDSYSPAGKAGLRPDRAVDVYCKLVRQEFGSEIPIVIGGLEASLRRFAHYDYWADEVFPSILVSSGADILSYGMGERSIVEIANRLQNKEHLEGIRGSCILKYNIEGIQNYDDIASFENVSKDNMRYAKAAYQQYQNCDHVRGKTVVQRHGERFLVQYPPSLPLSREELDKVYSLPYERDFHPSYIEKGGVPSIEEVQFSIIHNRGCFGGCNFCSLAFHQGRYITSRSIDSVVSEAEQMTKHKDFKGYISDVGGPTANFRRPSCDKQEKHGLCKDKKCLAPTPCKQLIADHSEYLDLLSRLREIKGVKKVFIRSGVRYDYLLQDKSPEFLKTLVEHHVSGQLKVAPEHCSARVLDKMGKPHIECYNSFSKKFYETTKKLGKEQYLVPYLMSSHPGSSIEDAVKLAVFLKQNKIRPEQVQDFYPTPGTISTAAYYSGFDPQTLKPVYVAKTKEEKQMQRALLQYFRPENYNIVKSALTLAGRLDLCSNAPNALIKPRGGSRSDKNWQQERASREKHARWDKSKKRRRK